jgi:hypothetical protein
MRCFLISSLLVITFTRVGFADRKISDAANVELMRGEEKFRQKDYAAAIAAFDAGYAIDPQPIFLYDKAQAQRLSGDCRTALATYKAFLATEPPHSEASRARKNVEQCEAMLPPPPHEPEPVVDSEPSPIEDVAPPSRAPAASIREQQRGWWTDGVGVSLVTAGAISIGTGLGFAVAARSAAADATLATNVNEWHDANQRWERDRIIAGVALGSGAALLVGGVLRLSLHDRGVAITPASGNGAVVSIGGAW